MKIKQVSWLPASLGALTVEQGSHDDGLVHISCKRGKTVLDTERILWLMQLFRDLLAASGIDANPQAARTPPLAGRSQAEPSCAPADYAAALATARMWWDCTEEGCAETLPVGVTCGRCWALDILARAGDCVRYR